MMRVSPVIGSRVTNGVEAVPEGKLCLHASDRGDTALLVSEYTRARRERRSAEECVCVIFISDESVRCCLFGC